MAHTDDSDQLDGLVGKAVEEYFRRSQRGERPQIDEFAEQYSEISDLLRTVIPALQAAEETFDASADGDVASERHKQLGDFRILRQIGRGGMGIVYEAEQISMTRRVALKVLPLAGLVDELKIRRFQNEVRAVAALDHPHIVPVYMVGEERGVHYYAMRLIRGRSLSEVLSSLRHVRDEGESLDGSSMSRITSMGKLNDEAEADLDAAKESFESEFHRVPRPEPVETVARADSSTIPHSSRQEYFRSVAVLGIQAATALQHAHDEGIVHRDIKPANLLLDVSAKLYITDFGLARIESDAGVTMTGDLIGTLRYMAPEQALGKRVVVDHRADIYSLAATLYELLTLQPAYVAEDRQELLKQIAFEEPTRLRRVDADIPTELETIVHKAMSKDRNQRYSSAQDLADDLQSHLEHRPIKAKPPTLSEALGKWTRRNPALTWASIITLSLVTITLAVSTLLVANQRNIAEDRLVRATTAERAATKAEGEATSQASKLARRIYLMHIANADNALLKERFRRAEVELAMCEQKHRGWEWHFLDQQMRATFPLPLPGSQQPIFTRDGKRLIAIGTSSTQGLRFAKTWDLASRQVVSTLAHDFRLTHIAVAPDEKQVAGGDRAGELFVWDVETGEKLWSFPVHEGRVDCLAFSPDGRLIASVSFDRTLTVVDAADGKERFTLGPFNKATKKVRFSPDGRWIASGVRGGAEPAMLIDVAAEKIAAKFSEEGGNMFPTFDPSEPNGRRIATANVDGSIKMWDWDGKQLTEGISWPAVDRPILSADRRILNIEFNADGTRLASTDAANAVKVWDTTTGELLAVNNKGWVYWLAFSNSGDEIALYSQSDGIRIWRWRGVDNGLTVKPLDGAVEAVFSPDGQFILASTATYYNGSAGRRPQSNYYPPESAVILNAESGKEVRTLDGAFYAASWSPDSREIVAGSASDDAIRVYEVATGEHLRTFPGKTGQFMISRVDPSGRRLISFSTNRTMRTWDFKSMEEAVEQRISAEAAILGAGFSRDTSRIAIGIAERVEVWDTRSATLVSTHVTLGYFAKQFAFSEDNSRVYVSSTDGLLTERDTATGQETRRFVGHAGMVRAVAIAPDEQYIVSADALGRVIVWDVASQQPLITLTDGDQLVTSLDWSSDGRRIVAGKEDGTIQIWTLPRSN